MIDKDKEHVIWKCNSTFILKKEDLIRKFKENSFSHNMSKVELMKKNISLWEGKTEQEIIHSVDFNTAPNILSPNFILGNAYSIFLYFTQF